MSTATTERIKRQLEQNKILLYMKGTPLFPNCGFSSQVVRILDQLNTNYAYVNVLENPDIRSELPVYAQWPTFPQLYIQGELIGGCDIITELFQKGELQRSLEAVDGLADAPHSLLAVE